MGSGFLWFRRRPAAEQHPVASILRLSTIFVTTAFGGFCLWLVATRAFSNPADDAVNYVCFAPAVVFSMLLLVNFLFTGLASWVSEDQDREWFLPQHSVGKGFFRVRQLSQSASGSP